MKFLFVAVIALSAGAAFAETPFEKHGRIRVAKVGTHLEHADGTKRFVGSIRAMANGVRPRTPNPNRDCSVPRPTRTTVSW